MDFMNLNQSAHGDREFGFIETRMGLRRKTVVGHWHDRGDVARRRLGACGRAAGTRRGRSEVARFGDNMREVAVTEGDKVEAQIRLGVVGQRLRRRRPRRTRSQGFRDGEVDRLVADYEDAYELAPALRAGGAAARVAARRRADRGRPARRSSTRGGVRRVHRHLRGSPRPRRSCPGIAVQRLMADGYGFGAEGDWKTAALVRIAQGDGSGLDGGTSFMEDYTYDLAPAGREGARRAHARGLPVDRRGTALVRDPSALDRRQGRSGAARLHGGARPGGRRSRCSTSATASGSC